MAAVRVVLPWSNVADGADVYMGFGLSNFAFAIGILLLISG
jgi:hypothetical protein